MASPVQEIKDKLDIVDFIRQYVPLQPAGKNFKALCPFHKEKTASFIVSPDRQTWHCFGSCSEGGDVFKFLMKYENLEFYEALKFLAEKAGIELRHLSPADQRQFGILYDINNVAKDFFKKELAESKEALAYLEERGLKKETFDEFEIGFASDDFEKLLLYLLNLGFNISDIERSGLAVRSERGKYIDRFRGRIMFPICNHFGKVVGFSARVLPQYEKDGIGKYINSPETPIFNKSRVFYGLHKAKNSIKEKNKAVLVEGQMDFLMLYQDGVKNTTATSGTALTADHLKTLRRFTDTVIFSFDSDEAGFKAVERSIDLANANDFNASVLILKEKKDPADFVLKSPGRFSMLADEAKPAMEFYFERYLGGAAKPGLPELKKSLRVVLSKIKNISSPVERSYWIKELSLKTRVGEKSLHEEMDKLKDGTNQSGKPLSSELTKSSIPKPARRDLIAQRILSILMYKAGLLEEIKEYCQYLPQNYFTVLKHITGEAELDGSEKELFNLISLRSSFEIASQEEENIIKEFRELLRQIKTEYLRDKRENLLHTIKEADANPDADIAPVLREFAEISKIIEGI